LLRLLWLSQPQGALVFDEAYYVNAARVMLGWPVPEGGFYAGAQPGQDPNTEHLPLGKLIIAGSMRLLGDNAFGWRLPSVLFGTAAVGLLYLLVRRLTGRAWVALFSAFIFSFDNLVFIHGRIATLDIFMLSFLLLGLYWYTVERPALAGAALALSTLCKLNGVYGLAAIAGFEVLRFALRPECRARLWRTAADLSTLFGSFLIAFVAVLWPLDAFWTGYDNPVDHVAHVYRYGVALRREGAPLGIESLPWQWLANQIPIPYLKVNASVIVDGTVVGSHSTVEFLGAMNPFVIAMLPLALAYLGYAALQTRGDFALIMLALFGATYLPPFAAAVLMDRISYIFYFLPVLPAICAGIAYFLLDTRLPRIVPLTYAASVLLGFGVLFPFRTLL
jgi:predicted membrane-bound dolichyl-phosphate-mannose-protein mannosyltransferase